MIKPQESAIKSNFHHWYSTAQNEELLKASYLQQQGGDPGPGIEIPRPRDLEKEEWDSLKPPKNAKAAVSIALSSVLSIFEPQVIGQVKIFII